MKTELSYIPNVHQMENTMAKERADFIKKQSDKNSFKSNRQKRFDGWQGI